MERVLAEADTTKPLLSSHNIALLYGAGDIERIFLRRPVEYVQGKSIANMLSRQEGFSVWDLQDIARQTCQGLDHAHARKVVHYSLVARQDPWCLGTARSRFLGFGNFPPWALGPPVTGHRESAGNSALYVARTVAGRAYRRSFQSVQLGRDPL